MGGRVMGWALPKLGVGTGTAAWGQGEHLDELRQVAEAALAEGSPFFDTAPVYGGTFAEQHLGQVLRGVPRGSYFVSTKAGYHVGGGESRTDLSRGGILRSVEGSLKRLRTDYVDILHLHDPDCCPQQALDEAFPTLMELRTQGVTRAVGCGMNQWQMLETFARQADLDACLLAGRYTLLEQESLGFLNLCAERGIAVLLGGVYNTGILATGAVPGARYQYEAAPPAIMERVRRIEAACARFGVPLHAAALQFALAHPAAAALVVGMQTAGELRAAQAGLAAEIPTGLWAALKDESLLAPEAPVPGDRSGRSPGGPHPNPSPRR